MSVTPNKTVSKAGEYEDVTPKWEDVLYELIKIIRVNGITKEIEKVLKQMAKAADYAVEMIDNKKKER